MLFIDALFRYYEYGSVILGIDLKNERAQYVYEKKLGFRRIGVQRNVSRNESEYYASVVYFEMSKVNWFVFLKELLQYTYSAE
jgi:Acetyltransferases, including N-acetylases of ribosomal proteins